MKHKFLSYIFIFVIQFISVSCSSFSRENIKYDYLNFIFQYSGNELNTFKNTFTKNKVTVNCFVDTEHKKMLLETLERVDFFSIPDNFNSTDFNDNRDYKLFIKHFGIEKTLIWNSKDLEFSIYRDKILEIENTLFLIQEDVTRYIKIPIPIKIGPN